MDRPDVEGIAARNESLTEFLGYVPPDIAALCEYIKHLEAALRYVLALSIVFPHVNTLKSDPDTVGAADGADGAWCLGCSVASTCDELVPDSPALYDRNNGKALAVIAQYEESPDA